MAASGFTLSIPYEQVLLLVMALFMFIGAMRGWYREFISSVVLIALAVFLIQPELATPVVRYISGLLRIILAFFRSGFSLDLTKLSDVVKQIELPFDANNPYMFFILVLVGFVVLSYMTIGPSRKVTSLSRILGGLLGLFNGFLVVSLFKEYVIKYFQTTSPALAAAGAPPAVAIAVGSPPTGGVLSGANGIVILVLLGLMVVVLLTSMATGKPIGKK
jgi:hypothetical protein